MDSDTEELYFQKLQELVQDEDRIVTVASFASDAGISIQNSQKLLKQYVEDHRKLKLNDLAVSYVLTGSLKGNQGKGVLMVKGDDLEAKQSLFENKPFTLIYSVQKTKNVDFNIIALVDLFDATKIREKALEGSIVSKNCVKRVLKVKKVPLPPPSTSKSKLLFHSKPGKSTEESKSAEKSLEPLKTEQKPKPSGNIANLFKAAAAKSNQQNIGKGSVSSSTGNNSSKQSTKKNSGLSGFLMSGASKSPKNTSNGNGTNQVEVKKNNCKPDTKNNASCNENQNHIKKEEVMEISDEEFEEQIVKKKLKKDEPVKKAGVDKKKQNKKRQRDKSQDMPSKKRKRIVERNDSDSDDLFERADGNEDIVDKSDDEPERASSPVREKPLPPKNKRRKAVEKTYTDEEGFVVTKMEYIYETASEDENEAPVPTKQEKQEKLEKVKTKAIDKKKPAKNQSTLMSFFKKV